MRCDSIFVRLLLNVIIMICPPSLLLFLPLFLPSLSISFSALTLHPFEGDRVYIVYADTLTECEEWVQKLAQFGDGMFIVLITHSSQMIQGERVLLVFSSQRMPLKHSFLPFHTSSMLSHVYCSSIFPFFSISFSLFHFFFL